MNVKDKIVIITGAGSGIGKATALLFGELGAQVIASDIHLESVNRVTAEIVSNGGNATAKEANVTHPEAVEELISSTVETYGQLDVMVNNAGIGGKQQAKTAEHTLEDWHNVIAVNQTGVFYCMKIALGVMVKQGYGNIVNVASLAGLIAAPNHIAYAASKAAVVSMTKTVALEYGKKNIRVNAVCPGYTETTHFDQMHASKPELKERLLRATPLNRYAKVDEIAESVYWLCSDQTSFITGQTLTIDGGISL